MWKLIFLVVIVCLAISIAKRVLANPRDTKIGNAPTDDANQKSAENMVQCSTCQIHLPRSEAFMVEGKFYCSHAHIERK